MKRSKKKPDIIIDGVNLLLNEVADAKNAEPLFREARTLIAGIRF